MHANTRTILVTFGTVAGLAACGADSTAPGAAGRQSMTVSFTTSASSGGDDDNHADDDKSAELELAPTVVDLPMDSAVTTALNVAVAPGTYSAVRDDPLNEADAYHLVGTACTAMERYTDAHASFERALSIAFARMHDDERARGDATVAIAIFRRLGAVKEVEALERRFA